MKILLVENNMENLREDDLELDGLKLYQYTDGYSFTSDSVLLANFVSAKHTDVCVEIGAGSGVVSILVNYKNKPKKIYAFEMQQRLAQLTQTNVQKNNMHEKIEVVCDKVQNHKQYIQDGSISVVFCNPPYFKNGTATKNQSQEIAIARHEEFLPLADLCCVSSKMLKFGGKFYVVYPASRLAELVFELKKNNLEPKNMFFAQPTQNKNASVVLMQCTKGAKSGVVVMPTLVTNNLDGDYVQTIQKLYKK